MMRAFLALSLLCATAASAAEPTSQTAKLEAQTAAHPGDAAAWYQLALERQTHGDFAGAAQAYAHVEKLGLANPVWAYNAACAHARLGDKERALGLLERAVNEGFRQVQVLQSDTDLAGLRSEPRFKALVAKLAAMPACPKAKELAFWVGEWDVADASGHRLGESSVQSTLNGCVIHEHWHGSRGGEGESFNLFDARIGHWRQTWVDSSGGIHDYVGDLDGGAMRFSWNRLEKDGATTLVHLTFTPLPDGRVRQLFEESRDHGKSFVPTFDGFYSRKAGTGR